MPAQGRLKDKSFAPADAHGCGACPHPVTGPAIKGSSNVFVNSLPALRVGDNGVHSACCGPNIWTAVKGSATVFINGRAAHRMGDQDQHCGGIGNLIEGSPNVIVGDSGAGGATAGVGSGNVPSELVCIQAKTLREAAKSGVPFCEKCKKIKCGDKDSDSDEYVVVSDEKPADQDDSKYCVDIHCHPILIPFHQNKEEKLSNINLWEESDDPDKLEKSGNIIDFSILSIIWFLCYNKLIPFMALSLWRLFHDEIFIEEITTLAAYTQSDFKKLAKGKVRVAFVSLTPIEYGFMTKPGLTKLVKAYKKAIISEINSPTHNYFKYLEKEYDILTYHEKDEGEIDGKKFKYKLVKNYEELQKFIDDNDKYKLKPLSEKDPAEEYPVNTIAVVLTVEGGHTLGCGQKDTIFYKITDETLNKLQKRIKPDDDVYYSSDDFDKSLIESLKKIQGVTKRGKELLDYTTSYGLTEKQKQRIFDYSEKSCEEDFNKFNSDLWVTIESNINKLKDWKHCPLFITLNHHFWNQLSGHSMTIPKGALGLTKGIRKNQVLGMNKGFTELGKKVVKKLLDNTDGKRRILIDTKHMSIASRIWYYTYLGHITKEGYNEYFGKAPSDQLLYTDEVRSDCIPIISSHSAVNGYETMKASKEGNDGTPPLKAYADADKKYKKKKKASKEGNDDTTYDAYAVADDKYKISKKFNNWDMNLSDEEIRIIYNSDGLIGINFDQRVSGGNTEGGKKRINRVVNNICHIAKVAKDAGFSDCWSCITIGTDFDGSINPINDFRTAEDFANLEKALKEKLDADVVDRIMYKNAMEFLKKNFR